MTDLHSELQIFGQQVMKVFGADASLQPAPHAIIASAPARDLDRAKRIFAMRAGMSCPDSMTDGLFLPEQTSLIWSVGGHLGETNLNYMSRSMNRRVDESQFDLEFFGTKLADYRIIDEVHAQAGPFFVLYRIVEGAIDPQLFYFDTREAWKMDIGYADYIRYVMHSFAPVFWHSLFIEEPLSKTRAAKLASALEFLIGKADNPYLRDLKARLDR